MPIESDYQEFKASSKEINEYIPDFISKKPFYLQTGEGEEEFVDQPKATSLVEDPGKWYDRGKKRGAAATKYRKGACENCGAMSHKTKECLSRPRAKGAKWTGRGIEADELVQDVQLGWSAKRDRWNGYDAAEYRNTVERFEQTEAIRKKLKREQDAANGIQPEDEKAEHIYAEESDMGRQQPTSTRNLRMREDTAKYLVSLDLESAKYDPKTRSMRDAGAEEDQAAALVAEENFVKAAGDAAEFERAQRFAWEAQERGEGDVSHLQANPTAGEVTRKRDKEERIAKSKARQEMLAAKYGTQDSAKSKPSHAAVIEGEAYQEFDDMGLVVREPKVAVTSKYEEDVFPNNHTSVWGSWWADFEWGYACCHSTMKNSYCTGLQGRQALEATKALESAPIPAPREQSLKSRKKEDSSQNSLSRLKEREEKELEEYKRTRISSNDPMMQHLGKDELLGI